MEIRIINPKNRGSNALQSLTHRASSIGRSKCGKMYIMNISIEVVVFWILLVDAIGANIVAWPGNSWYKEHFRLFSRWFPATKGWTALYLALVLFIGYLIF